MSDSQDKTEPVAADTAKAEVQIVKIKSRFAMLALRDGGKSAAALIDAADAFLQTERKRYHAWVSDALQALDVTLDQLPGSIPEALQAAYGQAMQIRDLGGTFGAPLVTEAADSLCELLYRLYSAELYSHEAIAMHQSTLRLVCAANQNKTTPAGIAELLAGLRKIVARYPRPLPPPRPPGQSQARPDEASH